MCVREEVLSGWGEEKGGGEGWKGWRDCLWEAKLWQTALPAGESGRREGTTVGEVRCDLGTRLPFRTGR